MFFSVFLYMSEYFRILSGGIMKTERTRCWKITEKVSFNMASEASYVYILSGQKSIQKLVHFGKLLKLNFAVKQCYLKGQKLGEMPKLAFSPNETF